MRAGAGLRVVQALTRMDTCSTQTKNQATKSKDTFTSEKMDAIIDLW
jgi:hypothetical protein